MTDNSKTIKCPACQKEMVKISDTSQGVNIDICLNGCGGIYFDNRKFHYFDEQNEDINEIVKSIEGKTFESVDDTLPRNCPVCGAKMVKNYSSIKKEVLIDDCYSCGGKFLDNGELQKIRAQYATEAERSEDVMKFIYSTVGNELEALDEKVETLRANRSSLKRLFDLIIGL